MMFEYYSEDYSKVKGLMVKGQVSLFFLRENSELFCCGMVGFVGLQAANTQVGWCLSLDSFSIVILLSTCYCGSA